MHLDPTLLADLAAAPCGSLALDERVAPALGWVPGERGSPVWGMWSPTRDGLGYRVLPRWTTSMNASLTLVPHGSNAVLSYNAPPASCTVRIKDQSRLGTCGTAQTPALATVLAALRAGGAA